MLCLLFALLGTAGAVPLNLTNQGYLADSNGDGLDGTFDLTFWLYDDAGASNPALWSETLSVTISDGAYAVVLGTSTPIDEALLDQYPLYVGLSVDGGAEMTPRHELTSAPYAILAETAFNVEGGTVDASSVVVGNTTIDSDGLKVNGSVVIDDAGNVSGAGGGGLPLGCIDGQLARWNGSTSAWECSNESFSSSVAQGITAQDVADWDQANSWGDHATEGYLTSESDPVFSASKASEICSGHSDPSDWTLYDGGNGLFVSVDTSACGFSSRPHYVSSLHGDSQHWAVQGGSNPYDADANSFEIYIRNHDGDIFPDISQATSNNWRIEWIAIPQ